jgi:PAS domain S-box-containing protein
LTRGKESTDRQATSPGLAAAPSGAAISADFFLVVDGSGSVRETSPSVLRFVGYRRSQLLGTSLQEILHPEDVPVFRSLLAKGPESPKEPVKTQLRLRRADGGWRSFGILARSVSGSLPLLVLEANDLCENQPDPRRDQPTMQLGGQYAQLSDRDTPAEESPSDGPLSPELLERAGARGETVLVALDDRKVSSLVCNVMRQLGYTVLEAASPADAEGFARVHRGDIQLLVTDLATPRVRGRAFVQSMREIRPGLKSLFVSCQRYGSLAERRVFESGARLLHDPFTAEELAHAARRALEIPND